MPETDINEILKNSNISYSPTEDPADARLRRFKEYAGFVLMALALTVIGGVCTYLTLASNNAETVKWAQTVLSAIVSGGIFFVIGKKAG